MDEIKSETLEEFIRIKIDEYLEIPEIKKMMKKRKETMKQLGKDIQELKKEINSSIEDIDEKLEK